MPQDTPTFSNVTPGGVFDGDVNGQFASEQGGVFEANAEGPVGPQGPQGERGIQGETGPQGERGETGAAGQQGSQGNQGSAGVGIVDITPDAGTDVTGGTQYTLTIFYTDASSETVTFIAPEGPQGPAGTGGTGVGGNPVTDVVIQDSTTSSDANTYEISITLTDGMVITEEFVLSPVVDLSDYQTTAAFTTAIGNYTPTSESVIDTDINLNASNEVTSINVGGVDRILTHGSTNLGAFTIPVNPVSPTVDTDIASRGYVDAQASNENLPILLDSQTEFDNFDATTYTEGQLVLRTDTDELFFVNDPDGTGPALKRLELVTEDLEDLSDVHVDSIATDDLIAWDAVNVQWTNRTKANYLGDVTQAIADEAADRTAADAAVTAAFEEADRAVTTNLAETINQTADTVRAEFDAADATIRIDYQAADTVLRTEYQAGDVDVTTAFQAGDATLRSDFEAADVILQTGIDDNTDLIQDNYVGNDRITTTHDELITTADVYSTGRVDELVASARTSEVLFVYGQFGSFQDAFDSINGQDITHVGGVYTGLPTAWHETAEMGDTYVAEGVNHVPGDAITFQVVQLGAPGQDGRSVQVIFAEDSQGANQSLVADEGGVIRKFVRFETYTGTPPQTVPEPADFEEFTGPRGDQGVEGPFLIHLYQMVTDGDPAPSTPDVLYTQNGDTIDDTDFHGGSGLSGWQIEFPGIEAGSQTYQSFATYVPASGALSQWTVPFITSSIGPPGPVGPAGEQIDQFVAGRDYTAGDFVITSVGDIARAKIDVDSATSPTVTDSNWLVNKANNEIGGLDDVTVSFDTQPDYAAASWTNTGIAIGIAGQNTNTLIIPGDSTTALTNAGVDVGSHIVATAVTGVEADDQAAAQAVYAGGQDLIVTRIRYTPGRGGETHISYNPQGADEPDAGETIFLGGERVFTGVLQDDVLTYDSTTDTFVNTRKEDFLQVETDYVDAEIVSVYDEIETVRTEVETDVTRIDAEIATFDSQPLTHRVAYTPLPTDLVHFEDRRGTVDIDYSAAIDFVANSTASRFTVVDDGTDITITETTDGQYLKLYGVPASQVYDVVFGEGNDTLPGSLLMVPVEGAVGRYYGQLNIAATDSINTLQSEDWENDATTIDLVIEIIDAIEPILATDGTFIAAGNFETFTRQFDETNMLVYQMSDIIDIDAQQRLEEAIAILRPLPTGTEVVQNRLVAAYDKLWRNASVNTQTIDTNTPVTTFENEAIWIEFSRKVVAAEDENTTYNIQPEEIFINLAGIASVNTTAGVITLQGSDRQRHANMTVLNPIGRYIPGIFYNVGDIVLEEGLYYRSIAAVNGTGVFNPANWEQFSWDETRVAGIETNVSNLDDTKLNITDYYAQTGFIEDPNGLATEYSRRLIPIADGTTRLTPHQGTNFTADDDGDIEVRSDIYGDNTEVDGLTFSIYMVDVADVEADILVASHTFTAGAHHFSDINEEVTVVDGVEYAVEVRSDNTDDTVLGSYDVSVRVDHPEHLAVKEGVARWVDDRIDNTGSLIHTAPGTTTQHEYVETTEFHTFAASGNYVTAHQMIMFRNSVDIATGDLRRGAIDLFLAGDRTAEFVTNTRFVLQRQATGADGTYAPDLEHWMYETHVDATLIAGPHTRVQAQRIYGSYINLQNLADSRGTGTATDQYVFDLRPDADDTIQMYTTENNVVTEAIIDTGLTYGGEFVGDPGVDNTTILTPHNVLANNAGVMKVLIAEAFEGDININEAGRLFLDAGAIEDIAPGVASDTWDPIQIRDFFRHVIDEWPALPGTDENFAVFEGERWVSNGSLWRYDGDVETGAEFKIVDADNYDDYTPGADDALWTEEIAGAIAEWTTAEPQPRQDIFWQFNNQVWWAQTVPDDFFGGPNDYVATGFGTAIQQEGQFSWPVTDPIVQTDAGLSGDFTYTPPAAQSADTIVAGSGLYVYDGADDLDISYVRVVIQLVAVGGGNAETYRLTALRNGAAWFSADLTGGAGDILTFEGAPADVDLETNDALRFALEDAGATQPTTFNVLEVTMSTDATVPLVETGNIRAPSADNANWIQVSGGLAEGGGGGVEVGTALPNATDGEIGELFSLTAVDGTRLAGVYRRTANDGNDADWVQVGPDQILNTQGVWNAGTNTTNETVISAAKLAGAIQALGNGIDVVDSVVPLTLADYPLGSIVRTTGLVDGAFVRTGTADGQNSWSNMGFDVIYGDARIEGGTALETAVENTADAQIAAASITDLNDVPATPADGGPLTYVVNPDAGTRTWQPFAGEALGSLAFGLDTLAGVSTPLDEQNVTDDAENTLLPAANRLAFTNLVRPARFTDAQVTVANGGNFVALEVAEAGQYVINAAMSGVARGEGDDDRAQVRLQLVVNGVVQQLSLEYVRDQEVAGGTRGDYGFSMSIPGFVMDLEVGDAIDIRAAYFEAGTNLDIDIVGANLSMMGAFGANYETTVVVTGGSISWVTDDTEYTDGDGVVQSYRGQARATPNAAGNALIWQYRVRRLNTDTLAAAHSDWTAAGANTEARATTDVTAIVNNEAMVEGLTYE